MTASPLRERFPPEVVELARRYMSAASGTASRSQAVAGDRLRVMAEYNVDIPVWDDNGPLTDPDSLTAELGVDADLVTDLIAWALLFDTDFDRDTHRDIGRELATLLSRALPAYEVDFQP